MTYDIITTHQIRRHVSSFAILISVITWVAIDQIVGYQTKKLFVPKVVAGESLFAEKSGRTTADFVINPLGNGLPIWAVFAAFVPGILLTILFFMDTQITALVVNRKDYKMKVCVVCKCSVVLVGSCYYVLLSPCVYVTH